MDYSSGVVCPSPLRVTEYCRASSRPSESGVSADSSNSVSTSLAISIAVSYQISQQNFMFILRVCPE
jgi:hypothetical protein